MSAQLVPYDSLNALQRQQVEAIEIHAEQIKFSGDIHGALHTLLSKPGPGVKGFALLADEVPVAFLLLKRPPVLPAWADEHSATLACVAGRSPGAGQGLRQGLSASVARRGASGVAGDQGAGVVGGCG